MQKRTIFVLSGLFLFFIGIFSLINVHARITGAFIGQTLTNSGSLMIALLFVSISAVLFLLYLVAHRPETNVKLVDSTCSDKTLCTLAKKAERNQDVRRGIEHLAREMTKGNFEAGLGRPGHVEGTGVNYLRDRKGGRLYFERKDPDTYVIVGKSGKDNQEEVIRRLRKIYS